jgi:exodeoxyribonuclease VII small subunit
MGNTDMDAKPFSFEDAMKRLEEIVRLLENGQVSLDESIKLYEEGVALVNSANSLLTNAKQKLMAVSIDNENNE